jgi:hypothetical protein
VSFYERTCEQQAALGFLVNPPTGESGEPLQNVPTVEVKYWWVAKGAPWFS